MCPGSKFDRDFYYFYKVDDDKHCLNALTLSAIKLVSAMGEKDKIAITMQVPARRGELACKERVVYRS